jgi:hypothetical protein
MTRKISRLILLLTTLALSLAVSIFGYAAQGRKVSALQKRRIAARGHLTGSRGIQQVITWQTANPSGGTLPYAKAHLAIEVGGRIIWQTDGGDTQYLVDSIRLTDLDGDGLPEITSLWWEGASAGAALRIFHWDGAKQSFVELRSSDDMSGVHRYQIKRAGRGAKSGIVVYVRSDVGAGWPPVAGGEYEVRGSEIARAGGGSVTTRGESGVEGQVFISPTRPGPIRPGLPNKAPYETTLVIQTAGEGREVARLKTGSDGRFRVKLPPGEYEIMPGADRPGRFLPRASPQQVKVLAGQFAQVTIYFDSGMR